jgi:hypothetical protein
MVKNNDMAFPPLQRNGIRVILVDGNDDIVMEVESDLIVEDRGEV